MANEKENWSVRFQQDENGEIKVIYSGEINLYVLLSVFEIEREKLKLQLVDNVK
jgi:hypothetical protein